VSHPVVRIAHSIVQILHDADEGSIDFVHIVHLRMSHLIEIDGGVIDRERVAHSIMRDLHAHEA
jgi:hypothetical protein